MNPTRLDLPCGEDDIRFHVIPLQSYSVITSRGAGGCIDVGKLDFELDPYKVGEYRISRMFIKERGRGRGTAILSMLCADADKASVTLVLEASPYHERTPAGVARLMNFYARFGFEEIADCPGTMRRTPS